MYTLAHLSDPHLGPLPRVQLNQLMSKRIFGYINWHSNRQRVHRPEVVQDLIDNIHAAAPDHIVVTGDLVNLALPDEIAAARMWLDKLGDPQHVTVIPGNHDAYVPGALTATRSAWQPFMTGDAEAGVTFPFVRDRGPIAIVGVNSAKATAPFRATGHLSQRQLGELRQKLRELGAAGKFRVVLLHHPPAPHFVLKSARLVEAEEFLAVIREEGAELVLHGHMHSGSLVYVDGKDGQVPVVGVPSASNPPGNTHPAAAFNLYRISGEPGAFACHMTSVGYTEANAPARLIADRQLIG